MNISAHGKYPVRHKNMWHGGRMITALTPQKIYKQMAREGMITAKGVRAGMNPAPTTPPLQTTIRVGDNSPQFSVKGDTVGEIAAPQSLWSRAQDVADKKCGGVWGPRRMIAFHCL